MRKPTFNLHLGHTISSMKNMPENHFHVCVTSPPYWGPRVYGIDPVIWNENEVCKNVGHIWDKKLESGEPDIGAFCINCGAWNGCLGNEPLPEMFINNIVSVCDEVWRVLRDDGTFWLNLGDSYISNWDMGAKRNSSWMSTRSGEEAGKGWKEIETVIPANSTRKNKMNLKVKDLCGIPWRVAIALQDRGWYLRADNLWIKNSVMPECLSPETKIFIKTNNRICQRDLNWLLSNRQDLENISILGPGGWKKINNVWKVKKNAAIKFNAANCEKNIICSEEHRFPISFDRRHKKIHLIEASNFKDNCYDFNMMFAPIGSFLDINLNRIPFGDILKKFPENLFIKPMKSDPDFSHPIDLSRKYGYKIKKYLVKKYNSQTYCVDSVLSRYWRKKMVPLNIFLSEGGNIDGRKIIATKSHETIKNFDVILDYDFGRFLGFYAAEGGFEKTRGHRCKFTFHKNEDEFHLFIVKFLKNRFNITANLIKYENKEHVDIRFSSFFMKKLIYYFVVGQCKTKDLNLDIFLNANADFRKGFLKGYIEGDGSCLPDIEKRFYGKERFSVASASKKLIDGFATICSSLNIKTSRYISISNDKRTGKRYKSYVLKTTHTNKKQNVNNSYNIPVRKKIKMTGDFDFIEIDVEDHYFIIENGLITHNSTKDRPTKAHEYIFLLTKSPNYYYDRYAVLEPLSCPSVKVSSFGGNKYPGIDGIANTYSGKEYDASKLEGRNMRTVWNLKQTKSKDNHFAQFPYELPKRALLAGSSEMGCCPISGNPYVRVLDKNNRTIKWAPSCKCCKLEINLNGKCLNDEIDNRVPCRVFDPFNGGGTTGIVAVENGRDYDGCDMKEEYLEISKKRIGKSFEEVSRCLF